MSHFTVTVKLSAERLARHSGSIDDALAEIMAPYKESTNDPRFTQFVDMEDVYLDEYTNKSTEKVLTPTGELIWSWDDSLRKHGSIGFGSNTHHLPVGHQKVQVPFKELYPTFATFCEGYHSAKRDPRMNRHGHWHNPNSAWDWYSIGGRWTGFYPIKPGLSPKLGEAGVFGNKAAPGRGDIVRVGDLDSDLLTNEERQCADRFFTGYQELLSGKKFDDFDGPRDHALTLGLLRIERCEVLAGPNEIALSWRTKVRPGDNRASWTDIAVIIDRTTFDARFGDTFSPLATYAALDDDGWHAPGKMGWFGCADDTPDSYVTYKKTFNQRFTKGAKPDDTLVVVDCHI